MAATAGVFSGLDGDQLDGIIEVLEKGAGGDPPHARSLSDLQKLGLTPKQSHDAMRWLYELRIGMLNPDLMTGILNNMDMDGREKGALLAIFSKMLKSKILALGRSHLPLIEYNAPKKSAEITIMRGGKDAKIGSAKKSQIPPLSRNSVNIEAFDKFVSEHKDDPESKDRYVAFVGGKHQKTGEEKASLVQEMYDKFGYVKMYVGKVTAKPRVLYIGSPERV